jgi:demethylmenaquinone methyltransferase/2-methoxy-6-polyprenyl-1,4-benzoquinol methylase
MLVQGRQKAELPLVWGDGLRLPFPDASFDALAIAFGLRNMADRDEGLREMARVLRPGGRLAILEFCLPANPLVRAGYLAYFRHILPTIGNLVSRSRAYSYLNDSVEQWPQPRALARILRSTGFARVQCWELSLGIAALHIAEKEPAA